MSLLLLFRGGGVPTNYADTLLVGSYAIVGQVVTDVFVRNDSLAAGAYAISGKDITDSVVRADMLSAGAYLITGGSITDNYTQAQVVQVLGGGGKYTPRRKKRISRQRDDEDILVTLQ